MLLHDKLLLRAAASTFCAKAVAGASCAVFFCSALCRFCLCLVPFRPCRCLPSGPPFGQLRLFWPVDMRPPSMHCMLSLVCLLFFDAFVLLQAKISIDRDLFSMFFWSSVPSRVSPVAHPFGRLADCLLFPTSPVHLTLSCSMRLARWASLKHPQLDSNSGLWLSYHQRLRPYSPHHAVFALATSLPRHL